MTNDYKRAAEILQKHQLSTMGLVKSPSGFRNTVWLTAEAAVKIYDNREGMAIEKWLYRDVQPDFAPQLLGEGDDYIVLSRIHGDSLFHLWYQIDRDTRRDYICKVGEIVRQMQKLTFPVPNPFVVSENWQQSVKDRLHDLTEKHRQMTNSIPESLLHAAETYVCTNLACLDDTELYPVYSDLHFDNLLSDKSGKLWLIDYEMMEAAPRDMLLDVWHRMLIHPFAYAGEEDDPHTKEEDYREITQWLREEVPDLFAHPMLQKRVNIYGILYELGVLTEYPGSEKPTERLWCWVTEKIPV